MDLNNPVKAYLKISTSEIFVFIDMTLKFFPFTFRWFVC